MRSQVRSLSHFSIPTAIFGGVDGHETGSQSFEHLLSQIFRSAYIVKVEFFGSPFYKQEVLACLSCFLLFINQSIFINQNQIPKPIPPIQ